LIDIYTVVITIPLQTFSLYLKGFFGSHALTTEDAEQITGTCLKIVSK
jgi:hypothetical protein